LYGRAVLAPRITVAWGMHFDHAIASDPRTESPIAIDGINYTVGRNVCDASNRMEMESMDSASSTRETPEAHHLHSTPKFPIEFQSVEGI
jgi:hypothetical protein